MVGRGRGKKLSSGTVFNKEIEEEEQPSPSRQSNNFTESSNDESTNEEEDDGTTCNICYIPWIKLTGKCEDWVQCDACDEYVCPKRSDKRYFRQ